MSREYAYQGSASTTINPADCAARRRPRSRGKQDQYEDRIDDRDQEAGLLRHRRSGGGDRAEPHALPLQRRIGRVCGVSGRQGESDGHQHQGACRNVGIAVHEGLAQEDHEPERHDGRDPGRDEAAAFRLRCAGHQDQRGKRDRHGFGEHLERGVPGEEIDHRIQARDELRIHHGPLWCLVGGP